MIQLKYVFINYFLGELGSGYSNNNYPGEKQQNINGALLCFQKPSFLIKRKYLFKMKIDKLRNCNN